MRAKTPLQMHSLCILIVFVALTLTFFSALEHRNRIPRDVRLLEKAFFERETTEKESLYLVDSLNERESAALSAVCGKAVTGPHEMEDALSRSYAAEMGGGVDDWMTISHLQLASLCPLTEASTQEVSEKDVHVLVRALIARFNGELTVTETLDVLSLYGDIGERAVLVDIGAGRGKVLLAACGVRVPSFGRCVGLEFVQARVAQAERVRTLVIEDLRAAGFFAQAERVEQRVTITSGDALVQSTASTVLPTATHVYSHNRGFPVSAQNLFAQRAAAYLNEGTKVLLHSRVGAWGTAIDELRYFRDISPRGSTAILLERTNATYKGF